MSNNPMPSLFELIARQWTIEGKPGDIIFNRSISGCCVALEEGGLTVIPLADEEPPHSRIRVSGDDGRSTISPREKAIGEAIAVEGLEGDDFQISAYLQESFLAGNGHGQLFKIECDGSVHPLTQKANGAVVGIVHHSEQGLTIVASAHDLLIWREGGPVETVSLGDEKAITALTLNRKGDKLAIGHENGVDIWTVGAFDTPDKSYSSDEAVLLLSFKRDGKWLLAALGEAGCLLIDIEGERVKKLASYPTAVKTVGWSAYSNCFVTSGAYRITAWSMENPPIEDEKNGALQTGASGMIAVTDIAVNPENDFVAAGFHNGKAALAKLGLAQELLLHLEEALIAKLTWSVNGRQLAIAWDNGKIAVVDFPPQMFK